MENNKNKKSVKFQGDMLNFCDFIQVFVFTRNHHLNGDPFHATTSFLDVSGDSIALLTTMPFHERFFFSTY